MTGADWATSVGATATGRPSRSACTRRSELPQAPAKGHSAHDADGQPSAACRKRRRFRDNVAFRRIGIVAADAEAIFQSADSGEPRERVFDHTALVVAADVADQRHVSAADDDRDGARHLRTELRKSTEDVAAKVVVGEHES